MDHPKRIIFLVFEKSNIFVLIELFAPKNSKYGKIFVIGPLSQILAIFGILAMH